MPDEAVVPEGWTQTTLGVLGRYLNGRAFKSSEWGRVGRPIIRIQDLTGSTKNPNFFDGEVADRYVVRPGDLLISWSATLGAYIWDGPEAVLNQHIFKVESTIDRKFHYHLVRDRLAELDRSAHGSGMVHVTKGIFDATPVAIPPDENLQRQIALLIDSIEAKQQSSAQHLSSARRAIKRFRQAILAAACSGHLTAEWRETHPGLLGGDLVTASLLERAKIRKLAGKTATPPDATALSDVPESWTVASIDQLCPIVTDGEHQTPPRTTSGVPLLSARNILNGEIVFEPIDHISEDTYLAISRRIEIQPGDVLLTCSGSIGRSAVVGVGMRFALVRSVAVLRPAVMNADFLSLALRSPWLQDQIDKKKTETAQANLFQGKIRALTVPVPPLDEQKCIVERVDQLMKTAQAIEQRIEAADRRVVRSSRAVLAKAFRGELLYTPTSSENTRNEERSTTT